MPTIDEKASVTNEAEQQEVFNMFAANMVNIDICRATGLTYNQVKDYRKCYEKRCHGEA
ncbi:hypothetical protein [Cellulosilyticum sp. WCF-2]|uniref:hypothetical protein n=1 Tax=Cellulosilyticum sp. WCF-2 TaxID=2497860 RepID=UPI0016810BB9|nr:hypothetical protein [Cellulosilyticum sp. WCF-2]